MMLCTVHTLDVPLGASLDEPLIEGSWAEDALAWDWSLKHNGFSPKAATLDQGCYSRQVVLWINCAHGLDNLGAWTHTVMTWNPRAPCIAVLATEHWSSVTLSWVKLRLDWSSLANSNRLRCHKMTLYCMDLKGNSGHPWHTNAGTGF